MEDVRYTPKEYTPTEYEKKLLEHCELSTPDGKLERQDVSVGGKLAGFIQLGFGFRESYVVKPINTIGRKMYCSRPEAIINLVRGDDIE